MRLTLLFLQLLLAVTAEFVLNDLPGPFINRLGGSQCPEFMSFDTTKAPVSPSDISVSSEKCSSGTLTFKTTEDALANYLLATEDEISLSLLVTELLVCPTRKFRQSAIFSFINTTADITIEWSAVFKRSTELNGTYTFKAGVEHMVILDLCLYTRFTQEEIDAQQGECFAARQTVLTDRGTRDVSQVKGMNVWDGRQWTRVLGYTHFTPWHVGAFVRIQTEKGTVTLSSGHLVMVQNASIPARLVKPGMQIDRDTVQSVRWTLDRGLYHFHTVSGFVQVGGVRVTCYTSRFGMGAVHAVLSMLRLLPGDLLTSFCKR